MTLLADVVSAYGFVVRRWDVGTHLDGLISILQYESGIYRFAHTCDRPGRGVIRCAPLLSLHTIEIGDAGPEISPSVLCRDCQLHGFVRGGQWVTA